jgi:hypothetical protein
MYRPMPRAPAAAQRERTAVERGERGRETTSRNKLAKSILRDSLGTTRDG